MRQTKAAQLHQSVLLDECVALIAPALTNGDNIRPSVYVDGTLGMAGHACAVLAACPNAYLVGIDRDPVALALAEERLIAEGYAGRFTLVNTTYDNLEYALERAGFDGADAVFMDLGLSSLQIDDTSRGFAYREDAYLDMRMNQSADIPTAADLLRELEEKELADLIFQFGEERFSRQIARRIVQRRQEQPITTSSELVTLLDEVIPAASKRSGGHPAKRTFQALRIAVNQELEILDDALENALAVVNVNGRVVIESYHSLEDRRVKKAFQRVTTDSAPKGLPVLAENLTTEFEVLTRKAVKAGAKELEQNTRSASVRLRAVKRIRPSRKNDT